MTLESRTGRPKLSWGHFRALGVVVAFTLLVCVAGGCGGGGSQSAGETQAIVASPGAVPNLKGHSLTYVSFGGDVQAAEHKAFLKPFESLSGLRVTEDNPIDYSKLKVQVETGNVQWDVAHADTFF